MAAFIPKGIAELGGMPTQGVKVYIVYLRMIPQFGGNYF